LRAVRRDVERFSKPLMQSACLVRRSRVNKGKPSHGARECHRPSSSQDDWRWAGGRLPGAASTASATRSAPRGRWYLCGTVIKRLPPDLQDMAAALGPCIQAAHAMVCQRPLARHRRVAAADQSRDREGVIRRVKGMPRDQCLAVAGAAGAARA
jgi:hypothetical protein